MDPNIFFGPSYKASQRVPSILGKPPSVYCSTGSVLHGPQVPKKGHSQVQSPNKPSSVEAELGCGLELPPIFLVDHRT